MNMSPSSKSTVPAIRTELPGPRAKSLIARDEVVMSPSYTRAYPLVVARGEGATLEDVDGNLFLDFTAGIAVCATGHCHPRVVAAIEEQSRKLLHMSGTDFYNEPQLLLAEKLAALAPGPRPKRVFMTNSGAEAVEAAVKLSRHHSGRQHLIAFYGGFHGRTLGAVSLSASKVVQRNGFAPLIPGVTHIPFPRCQPFSREAATAQGMWDGLEFLEQTIFKRLVAPESVAAIVVEPIQGEGGYLVPPEGFHAQLRSIADRHGILLVADEVQSGMGRTGKMFAMEHWNVVPDIICVAKGIASGLPLGAIIAPAEIMDWPRGAHASTFGGNPVACAAALETIALLEESLMHNAQTIGARLTAGLIQLASRRASIADVRGKGLMIGMELRPDSVNNVSAGERRDRLVQECFRRGLLILGCGDNTIRLAPPLIIDAAEAETALSILDQGLESLETA